MENTRLESKIAELRERAGLTQHQLSQKVGVTETTIANWEKGRSGLECIEKVLKLCETLNCQVADLIKYVPSAVDSSVLVQARGLLKPKEEDNTDENKPYPITIEIIEDETSVTDNSSVLAQARGLLKPKEADNTDENKPYPITIEIIEDETSVTDNSPIPAQIHRLSN
ncbi:helix-turn-helix transcriptional regulator [Nostoc sp. ChiSLP03a]|uniref:helix-turn-helix transcriptional regulator n=1 Tax=Nostoc sp. ChiSLP03a TaxID=3075380 RepID=UPI002AD2D116|nr:helix-turn-helix transcriptional regulator [Nostoc sp. ChiSLP03a]MDZ8213786.1 helix-turn-helix transcriptional regulator [Nostoc sp. ChiSLP03a]